MDDDLGDDADFLALASALDKSNAVRPQRTAVVSAASSAQPAAAAAAFSAAPQAQAHQSNASSGSGGNNNQAAKIAQPTPQALPTPRSGPSSILVSTRQKGNPVLAHIHSLPWEYGDMPADYVLGATTCALFLSLKYHRLHPEYIYSRIRALGRHRYELRVLLAMVDVDNHEEPLRELAKTSLVNDLTLICAWSAREAARYLEAFKTLERAAPTAIRAPASAGYGERMVDFVTVPRGVNRADALGLVARFGTLRGAVNALPEEIASVQGWGEVKVRRWCGAVREPFRAKTSAKRAIGEAAAEGRGGSQFVPLGRAPNIRRQETTGEDTAGVSGQDESRNVTSRATSTITSAAGQGTSAGQVWEPGDDEEEALMLAEAEEQHRPSEQSDHVTAGHGLQHSSDPDTGPTKRRRVQAPELSKGIQNALARYRE